MINEIMDHLSGCKYFSSLDMHSGYYQVEMQENYKERTALTVGLLGFFEFVRMLFGLANSPTTFQRLMEQTLAELHMQEAFPFLDDINVPDRYFPQELERLEHKCKWFNV